MPTSVEALTPISTPQLEISLLLHARDQPASVTGIHDFSHEEDIEVPDPLDWLLPAS